MRTITVHGADPFRGVLRVPGDKSISHRVALLALLADGVSTIDGFLESDDCLRTLAATRQLGADVQRTGASITVIGTGGRLQPPSGPLDLGNSGTGLRLLAGILAAQPFASVLIGDASLSSRPMRRIAEPLRKMGAQLSLSGDHGGAPVAIRGGSLTAITYALPVASAQVKSCILLAGLFARGRTVVIEPLPTRDHTEQLFRMAGLPIVVDGEHITVTGSAGDPVQALARNWQVPGDFSSAAFWMAAAAAMPGADITLDAVGINSRRTAFADWLCRMGAVMEITPVSAESVAGEPCGRIRIRGGAPLRGAETGGAEIPNLIDELPLVAVTGALGEGSTVILDAAELRVKESDRIAVMARNLEAMGVAVEEFQDGMRIEGCGGRPRGGCSVDSHGDHRVAMAMAIMACFAQRPVTIRDIDCTETSFPGFWQTLERMGAHVAYGGGD